MTLRIAILAACAGTLVLTSTGAALATNNPIPGIDIIVKKNPPGSAIRVGDCLSGGGKIVKMKATWVCTGLPATRAASKPGRLQLDAAPNGAKTKQNNSDKTNSRKTGGESRGSGFAPLKPAEF